MYYCQTFQDPSSSTFGISTVDLVQVILGVISLLVSIGSLIAACYFAYKQIKLTNYIYCCEEIYRKTEILKEIYDKQDEYTKKNGIQSPYLLEQQDRVELELKGLYKKRRDLEK